MSPEALDGGPLARLRDGDLLSLDAGTGLLEVLLDDDTLHAREAVIFNPDQDLLPDSLGRGLFATLRQAAGVAHDGASVFK